MAQRDLTTAGSAIPRFSLKSIAIHTRMSEETVAFNANVYLDAKKVGAAWNDGHGGSTAVMIDPPHRARVEPLFFEVANAIAPIVIDGKTRCCHALVVKQYETIDVCATCKRMIHRPGEPFIDGAAAYVVDQLIEREQRDREERKLRKIDREQCTQNESHGMLTLRWTGDTPRGQLHVWAPIKPDQTPEQVGEILNIERKCKGTWKVVS